MQTAMAGKGARMKPDWRPDWFMVRIAVGYIAGLILLAWVGRTYFHMSMFPLVKMTGPPPHH